MNDYFNFNRKEKIGVLTLAVIIVAGIFILNIRTSSAIPDPFVDPDKIEYYVFDEEDQQTESLDDLQVDKKTNSGKHKLKPFNPNFYSKENWVSAGFSDKQAKAITNYIENYGPLKSTSDFKKIYVVNDYMFDKLSPLMVFESDDIVANNTVEIPQQKLDLNSAGSTELENLKWIGPTFASRIISERTKIGGFVHYEQLKKLNLSEQAIQSLEENTVLNLENIRRKNVNSISKKELKSLPFTNWIVVAEIIKQRDQGPIKNLDFLTVEMISAEDKLNLLRYLSF